VSVPFLGFTGPTYRFNNQFAAIERSVNWYPCPIESPEEGKTKATLEPSPANAAFSILPVPAPFNQPNRGLLELRGVAYGVNGTIVFSIDKSGNYTNIGTVISDGTPCSMVANGNGQIFIASAGYGYVIPALGGAGSLIAIPIGGTGFLGATYATFQDGYILVINPTVPGGTIPSNVFQISGTDSVPLGDATQWDAANVSVQAGQADYLRSIFSFREYLHLIGHRRTQIYYDIGANGIGSFPFQSYNETFIETGTAAAFSLACLGDSLVIIGEDDRGIRAAWRIASFITSRISNFAVEQFWQKYARIDDAVAFSFIWNGHLLYQVTFPSAILNYNGTFTSATWVYDATASAVLGRATWHERSFRTAYGLDFGRSELFHCYAYGKHLVGSSGLDGNPGAVYAYSDTQVGDCGLATDGSTQVILPLVRKRVCPHIWTNNKRIIFNRIEFELSKGQGTPTGQGQDPTLMLRWSNDAGNNWGPWQTIEIGRLGQYSIRALFNRCGYGRDRVFEVNISDPVFCSLITAELDLLELAS